MIKVEQSGERTAQKGENFGEKLRRVGKRAGQTTPVASFFRYPQELHLSAASAAAAAAAAPRSGGEELRENCSVDFRDAPFRNPCFSARKLAAALWELHHYHQVFDKMHHRGAGVPPPRLRRLNHHQISMDKNGGHEPLDPSPSSPDLAGSCSTLRRQVVASLMQHHHLSSAERTNHAMQPVSPASYGSSMEIAAYNPALTPTSSVELKGRGGSLRTSTELLKVLNRIWTLEEQHISNMSLVKTLKKDLEHSRSQIKALTREQQIERHEMNELIKQIKEDKIVIKKNKDQERIEATIQSMRGELEDERKLRKRSESLHRKLAREIQGTKSILAEVSKDLEKERCSRNLLEDLCDEFALGIRDYDKQVHSLAQKSDMDYSDRLILHVSESWLDERMQLNSQAGPTFGSAVEKLSTEIEAFLRAKRSAKKKSDVGPTFRRSSLESIPLNLAVSSAPRDMDDDDDDSASGDSNCFELEKVSEFESALKNQHDENSKQREVKKKHGEIITDRVEDGQEKREADEDCGVVSNSNNMIKNLIRNHYLLSESKEDCGPASSSSVWRSQPSPVRQWTEKLPSNVPETSGASASKLHPDLKENTLKAKLFEARTRGQRLHSRVKGSIVLSRNK
ncbi:hypothetical protein ABFS82_01G066100 [Erythranthe guttata]|uniref:Uncharacterized protein n=1 Tax=Erythranthe guttata TaxID=4155 RepID=A0A022QA41_ERYGU|nr:PREDICTED: uncharacterized protein At5g41620-like [Erythranthe guttata]EYU23395.1 hypothetical protein MIMGU_mgv1a002941mg [Erythranthe guttata]|eukprot:XP_012854307.1 PREDICTED: uncharacterized protein At5g41620-like [Erythranthe guttata]